MFLFILGMLLDFLWCYLLGFLLFYPLKKKKVILTSGEAAGVSFLLTIGFVIILLLILPEDSLPRNIGPFAGMFFTGAYLTFSVKPEVMSWIQKYNIIYFAIAGVVIIIPFWSLLLSTSQLRDFLFKICCS